MPGSISAKFYLSGYYFQIAASIYVFSTLATAIAIIDKVVLLALPATPLVWGAIAVFGLALCIAPLLLGHLAKWSTLAAVLTGSLTAIMLAVVAPRFEVLHAIGRGTDQGSCISAAAQRMAMGLWPYDIEAMWSHNPMSCGPAWVALHLPLLLVVSYSYAVLMLILLSWLVMAVTVGIGRMARFIAFLAPVPGYWLALANGNDFPTAAIVLAAVAATMGSPWTGNKFALAVLGAVAVAVSHFRFPFLLLPIFLLPLPPAGRWRGLANIAMLLAAIGVWLLFYEMDSASFVADGPMHVIRKFSLPGGPLLSIVLVAVLGSVVFLGLLRSTGRFDANLLLLAYLAFIIVGSSAQDLVAKLQAGLSVPDALASWEGTSWLTGAACFAAWVLSSRESSQPLALADAT